MDPIFDKLPFLFPFFFAGMWVLTTFLLSRRGWAALADRYEAFAAFSGTRIGIISATVGGVEYRNSLVLRYSDEGFYLRPVVLFRLFHKPLLIPWQEIRQAHLQQRLFYKVVELTIGEPRVSTIRISEPLFRKLSPFIPAAALRPGDRY